jgi:hypothetical protein
MPLFGFLSALYKFNSETYDSRITVMCVLQGKSAS